MHILKFAFETLAFLTLLGSVYVALIVLGVSMGAI
tara:strand:+ start:1657 stop:1761 length:105 start_codon:yes stop_codon:yes gene_type:complete